MRRWLVALFILPLCLFAIDDEVPKAKAEGAAKDAPAEAVDKVLVQPTTPDEQIAERLQGILKATGWFYEPHVQVKEGIVFLFGVTRSDDAKQWASTLAQKTQNVVAVVNKMDVIEPSPWDFSSVTPVFEKHWRGFLKASPAIVLGIIILVIAGILAHFVAMAVRWILRRRAQLSSLLIQVISKAIALFIFLIGVYLIFELVNLTGAALTIISGTGILGIILGIAFRDITENFLSSILLSIQHPFKTGDLIDVGGQMGYVQQMTMRVTILMALDGKHIQIPNAIVYKSYLHNYTSNPIRRIDFVIGIGYESSMSRAQEIALEVLQSHEAIVKDPEPLVLVEGLGKSSVNLVIYCWFDSRKSGFFAVKSSAIRLIKAAFTREGIIIPDEGRERIFPKGLTARVADPGASLAAVSVVSDESDDLFTSSEVGRRSEAEEIKKRSKESRKVEGSTNLLENGKKDEEKKQDKS